MARGKIEALVMDRVRHHPGSQQGIGRDFQHARRATEHGNRFLRLGAGEKLPDMRNIHWTPLVRSSQRAFVEQKADRQIQPGPQCIKPLRVHHRLLAPRGVQQTKWPPVIPCGGVRQDAEHRCNADTTCDQQHRTITRRQKKAAVRTVDGHPRAGRDVRKLTRAVTDLADNEPQQRQL